MPATPYPPPNLNTTRRLHKETVKHGKYTIAIAVYEGDGGNREATAAVHPRGVSGIVSRVSGNPLWYNTVTLDETESDYNDTVDTLRHEAKQVVETTLGK